MSKGKCGVIHTHVYKAGGRTWAPAEGSERIDATAPRTRLAAAVKRDVAVAELSLPSAPPPMMLPLPLASPPPLPTAALPLVASGGRRGPLLLQAIPAFSFEPNKASLTARSVSSGPAQGRTPAKAGPLLDL